MKNGFTLIELLAVIVILAIIAIIATPIVLNIIDDTKESAQLRSAEMYLGAVETAVAKQMMEDTTFKPTSCEIQENGNLKCDEKDVKVEISGEKPTSGTITLEQRKIQNVELVLNEKTIVKNDEGKLVYEEPPVPLQSGLYDEEDNLIATWDELVNYYGVDIEKNYYQHQSELNPSTIILSNEKLSKGVKLVIDSSITEIGSYAFYNWTSLKEIIIPDSIINIGSAAFYNCNNLTKVKMGNAVTTIGSFAFAGCTSLTEVIIPNSVTSIGDNVFKDCTSLKAITIPNSVTSIGNFAFQNCTSLIEIVIPNRVTSISYGMFYNCTNLTKVTIGTSITSIGTNAFAGCTSLTEIIIPKSVISVDSYAFNSATSLKIINYTGTEEQWNSISLGEFWDYRISNNYTINYNYVVK